MKVAGNRSLDTSENQAERNAVPRATDWFWSPWYAKALWAFAAIYWIGLYAMMLAPAEWLSSSVAGAMVLLVFLFNPITVIVILGRGFLKAKVARADWIIVPGMSAEHAERQRRERDAAYINPADARSGYMHQDHLDGL